MYKEYNAKVNITAIAKDYVESLYENFRDDLWLVEGIEDITKLFPGIEDDILDEVMRLITIDYCKKKVKEKENKPNELKVYAVLYMYEPIKLFLDKEKAETCCNEYNRIYRCSPYSVKEYLVEV